ncbi:MAG: hypothetical protein Q8Q09_01485 [Deltaproteobacteria bacterium]|nr:hypothetical protein [Deltaproteobacteria bacterium]
MTSPPVLQIREWSRTTPACPHAGALLREARLSESDRALLATLERTASIRFTELRSGLAVAVGSHIGTITLSALRVVIMPKIRIESLMRMVAYAFDLSDLVVRDTESTFAPADHGLMDLLGLSLLRAIDHIARGKILPKYEPHDEDLASPRGRIDMRHLATRARGPTLRCTLDELTRDHPLNQALAAGLRLGAKLMDSDDLRLDLTRTADRLFGDLTPTELDTDSLARLLANLDRRSSHYRSALTLIALLRQGAHLGRHDALGVMPLHSFTLDMNKVFERFLERYLTEHAPPDFEIFTQDQRKGVFRFIENSARWRHPVIKPDLVFCRDGHPIALADAKYKDRHDHPPSTAELYQLTTYGLAYPLPEPRDVLLLHPLTRGTRDHRATLLFAPHSATQPVRIRLVGVPLDELLDGSLARWWPL